MRSDTDAKVPADIRLVPVAAWLDMHGYGSHHPGKPRRTFRNYPSVLGIHRFDPKAAMWDMSMSRKAFDRRVKAGYLYFSSFEHGCQI